MAKDTPILVTTTPSVEGRRILEYKGLVGGRAGSYEKVLRGAKTQALEDMIESARERGANAIVGVDLDYETVQVQDGGAMLMVSASGTAVVIE